MNAPRSGFVDVEELMRRVSLDDVSRYYGVPLDAVHRVGDEIRTRCFLNCGKSEPTGDRVLAIKVDDVKRWCCHRYECDHKAGGNLVGLIDLVKPGEHMNGRPRGERFKAILSDLRQIAGGPTATAAVAAPAKREAAAAEQPKVNVPLAESGIERARALVNLHEKFVVDAAAMNPAAASYFRKRPYLTPDVCRKWQVGYLPRDAGGDASGGTMRGKVCYPMHNDAGQILSWFGRDPQFEEKHAAWKSSDRSEREPEKFHFVKNFFRGQELFGVHRFREQAEPEKVHPLGVLAVEGPNDAIRLDTLGVPSVAICSNHLTKQQAEKLSELARQFGGGTVTLMFDLDDEGQRGMEQALFHLAERCRVRVAWSRAMYGGRFAGRQPESLSDGEWASLAEQLMASYPGAE